ncbi:hypothetical protein [Teredinibacter turnerae]|uniref:hypothetical protein n=1 Tax=Teredinibacter turnerae TaxID=2426 RepID=UPI0030D5B355
MHNQASQRTSVPAFEFCALATLAQNSKAYTSAPAARRYVYASIEMMRIILITLILLLSSCSVVAERQDWSFVQSAGGIIVGGLDKNPNWLVLRGDVSGLKEFTVKPTQINSALALKSVKALVVKGAINLYITTTVISKSNSTTAIQGVDISGVDAGHYIVQYLNKDGSLVKLGEVTIQR